MFGIKSKFAITLLLIFVGAGGIGWGESFEPGAFYASGPTRSKKIALTFDDGPGPFTPRFLDLLERYDIKATFFMLGQQVRWRPAIAQQVKMKGHEIGNHTWQHTNFKAVYNKMKDAHPGQDGDDLIKEDLRKDIKKTGQTILGMTKTAPRLLRMPHGIDRPWVNQAAKEEGYVVVNWTHGTDWLNQSAADLLPGYVEAIKSGAILLFHDGGRHREKSLALVEDVIQEAKKKGYQFVTVSELLQFDQK